MKIYSRQIFRIIILFIFSLSFQGCYTYKTTTMNELKIGKYYEVKVIDGRKIENQLIGVTNDSLKFTARNLQIDYLKTDIQSIKRRKTSPIVYVVSTSATAAAFLSVTTNKKEPVLPAPPK